MIEQMSPGERLAQDLRNLRRLPCGCVPDEPTGPRCVNLRKLLIEKRRASEAEDWRRHHDALKAIQEHLHPYEERP